MLPAFLELVRCGISGATPSDAPFRGLTDADWEEIFILAQRQTVAGICYDALCRLPDSLLPAGMLLPRWVARVSAIETSARKMAAAVPSLVAAFRTQGLHPVVQKGQSVARFYPNPELRESGDIDLWLPAEELDRALAFVSSKGAHVTSHPDASHSFVYHGIVVELHSRLIGLSAPRAARRLSAYIDRYKPQTDHTVEIPSPAPLLELLLVSVHIMRHAFGTGIGLRQFCDYYCAAAGLKGHYDSAEYSKACADLGLSRWTALLNDFMVKYFGADPAILPPSGLVASGNISADALMAIVAEGGNFGQHRSATAAKSESSKLHTAAMLLRRSRFSLRVAPAEAFWNIAKLAAGQRL